MQSFANNVEKSIERIAAWLAKNPYGDSTPADVEKELLTAVSKHTLGESEPTAVLDALMELPAVGQAKPPLAYLRYIAKAQMRSQEASKRSTKSPCDAAANQKLK